MSVKTCVAVDCSKPQHARGYCNGHYYRLGLYSALAREFGVSSRHISTLVRGQRKATS